MLSFLKKSSAKSSGAMVPAWHPNFRNFERLPDAKAVRKLAFLNAAAVAGVLALGAWVGYREYALKQLQAEAAQVAVDIEALKPTSDKAVAVFKQFKEEEKKIYELRDFLDAAPILVSDFILSIGETRPSDIKLTNITCDAAGAVLLGSSSGAPDEATERARVYVEKLQQDPKFARFTSISLNSIVRDSGSGDMKFEIAMKLKVATPKKTTRKKR